jgi:hypothetical protein
MLGVISTENNVIETVKTLDIDFQISNFPLIYVLLFLPLLI